MDYLTTLTNQELKAVWLASDEFEGDYLLNSIHIFSRNDTVILEATDRNIIIRFTKFLDYEPPEFEGVFHKDELKPFLKGGKTKQYNYDLYQDGYQFNLVHNKSQTCLNSRLVEEYGKFPDLDKVFPNNLEKVDNISPNCFGVDLEKMQVFCESIQLIEYNPVVKMYLPKENHLPIYMTNRNRQWEGLIMPCKTNYFL